MLTAEQARELLDYDPATGEFTWRVARGSGVRPGDRASPAAVMVGGKKYRRLSLFNRKHQAHRVAWLMHYGVWPSSRLDHANGDGCDNRIANLRLATGSQNSANTRLNSNNKSGAKGVFWHAQHRRWIASITVNYRRKHLGSFTDKGAAVEAYRRAAIEHFGEFARPETLPDVRRLASGSAAEGPFPSAANHQPE